MRQRTLPIVLSSVVAISAAAGCASTGTTTATGTTPATPAPSSPTSTTPVMPATPATSPTSTAPPTVVVGSADFPENVVVAEIYAQALTAKGVTVTRKFNLGSRDVTYAAISTGSISVIPEYNGALLDFIAKKSTASPKDATDTALAAALPPDLEILDPAPAEDNDALVVTASTAAQYHLKSISDLSHVAGGLVLGAAPEFQTRRTGLVGLKSAYGLTFKSFKPLDAGGPITVAAIRGGEAQVVDLYTTDPAITTDHLVPLTDAKGVFGAENVIPLASRTALPQDGADALNAVSAKLTTPALGRLIEQVVVEKKDPDQVARAWLASVGLV